MNNQSFGKEILDAAMSLGILWIIADMAFFTLWVSSGQAMPDDGWWLGSITASVLRWVM